MREQVFGPSFNKALKAFKAACAGENVTCAYVATWPGEPLHFGFAGPATDPARVKELAAALLKWAEERGA
jgi:hypothetical protein